MFNCQFIIASKIFIREGFKQKSVEISTKGGGLQTHSTLFLVSKGKKGLFKRHFSLISVHTLEGKGGSKKVWKFPYFFNLSLRSEIIHSLTALDESGNWQRVDTEASLLHRVELKITAALLIGVMNLLEKTKQISFSIP